jgi:Apea-like HEPN
MARISGQSRSYTSMDGRSRLTRFAIGPVTFLLRDRFFHENETQIDKAVDEAGLPQVKQKLFARVESFYSDFQWIASITVPPCDPEISRHRARVGVQKALDVFKLVVGGERARHVRQGYDLTAPSDFAELVSSSPGSFHLRFGWKGHDAITNEHWYEQVQAGPAWALLQSALLRFWTSWGELDEIEMRFFDALAWHSDAISEQDPGARIIKFWTSIERTLRTYPGDIDTRAAVLSSDTSEDFAYYSLEFENAYRKRRNDVVHGNASRTHEPWYREAVSVSEEASKNVLFQYLYAIPHIRLHQGATARKKIRAWLRRLDNVAGRFRSEPASK